MSASWPTGRATVRAISKALESRRQYLGMPLREVRDHLERLLDAGHAEHRRRLGRTLPSATTAALLVLVVCRR